MSVLLRETEKNLDKRYKRVCRASSHVLRVSVLPHGSYCIRALWTRIFRHHLRFHDPSSTCYGPECFRMTFVILATVCGVAAILGVILTVRIRPVYRSLYSP
ncbi:Uncharacterized protein Rs2_01446 [Raphanus sativus]|nr:Uncharacterized protein Rs2_01446 [Raphanus sativus]